MKNKLVWSVTSAVVAAIMLAIPVLSAEPHEDPLKVGWEYSGLGLFRYYSAILDEVINKNRDEVASWLDNMPYANLPPSLISTTEIFTKATEESAELIVTIEKELDELRVLLQQSRILEANPVANQIIADLSAGYRAVQLMERAILTTGKAFLVDAEKPNSPLRLAYTEVIRKIASINALFDLYRDILANLLRGYVSEDVINEIESIRVYISEENTDRTTIEDTRVNTSEENTDRTAIENIRVNAPEIRIDLIAAVLKSRLATELSLTVEPMDVFVGDYVSAKGTLTVEGQPLVNRMVEIMLNGLTVATGTTNGNGYYEASFQVPYEYSVSMDVQSLYYPREQDTTTYLASLSPKAVLNVHFYEMLLSLDTDEKGYPGRETVLKASWTYQPAAPTIERNFEVRIDDVVVAQLKSTEEFIQKINLPPDLQSGLHRLTVISFAEGRYASGIASGLIDVSKAVTGLTINLPKIMLVPLHFDVNGSVISELGPLQMALVRVKHASDAQEFHSADDGSFQGKLRTRYTFGLVGSESWTVEVIPQEPWNSPLLFSQKVLVINGINCGIFLTLLIALGIIVPKKFGIRNFPLAWQREKIQPEDAITGINLAVVPVYSETVVSTRTLDGGSDVEPRARIFSWYVLLIQLVQRVTRIVLRPHQTLREFVNGTRKTLGPVTDYLLEFTRLIERLLYSREQASDKDVNTSEQLTRQVQDSLKHENT